MPTWEAYETANVTNIYQMMSYANSVTDSLFGVGLTFAFFSIFFIVFRRFGDDSAFTAASFITFVLSVLMRAMGLLGDIYVIFFALATAFSIVLLMRK